METPFDWPSLLIELQGLCRASMDAVTSQFFSITCKHEHSLHGKRRSLRRLLIEDNTNESNRLFSLLLPSLNVTIRRMCACQAISLRPKGTTRTALVQMIYASWPNDDPIECCPVATRFCGKLNVRPSIVCTYHTTGALGGSITRRAHCHSKLWKCAASHCWSCSIIFSSCRCGNQRVMRCPRHQSFRPEGWKYCFHYGLRCPDCALQCPRCPVFEDRMRQIISTFENCRHERLRIVEDDQ